MRHELLAVDDRWKMTAEAIQHMGKVNVCLSNDFPDQAECWVDSKTARAMAAVLCKAADDLDGKAKP